MRAPLLLPDNTLLVVVVAAPGEEKGVLLSDRLETLPEGLRYNRYETAKDCAFLVNEAQDIAQLLKFYYQTGIKDLGDQVMPYYDQETERCAGFISARDSLTIELYAEG